MTTVGFAENIVDMLTTPSSISLGGNGTSNPVSGYLDAKNYRIQAFSVSKEEEQFSQNLHSYSTNNFLINSELGEPRYWTGAAFSKVAIGDYAAVGLTTDGSCITWGTDKYNFWKYDYSLINTAPTGTGFTDVDMDTFYAVAIDSNGSLVGWGDN